jgi:pimeloyl-ACP methyl ester carboxylesterase
VILHADVTGAGPPVALLHGLFGRARNLASIARGLAGKHRVLALDLRNHGDSPHAPGMAYTDLAADVLETLAARDALPCALLAPQSVQRLLVADIAPVAYQHHNRAVAAAMQAVPLRPGLTRAQAASCLADAVPDAAVRSFLLQNLNPGEAPTWRIGLAEIADGMADIEGWPDALANAIFTGPTLFINGSRSDYVTASHRDEARRYFPTSRFMTLKDVGHWLHADQPSVFLNATQVFLSDNPA